MLRLPTEILVNILKTLHYVHEDWGTCGIKDDLLSTRAVCKRLANIGASLAFRHVKLIQDQEGYSRLRALSKSCHRTDVHLLTYSFEDLTDEALSEEDYDGSVRADAGRDRCSLYNTDEMYKCYCRGREHQAHLRRSDTDVARLNTAFNLLENLSAIRISQLFSDRPGPWRGGRPAAGVPEFLNRPTSGRVFDAIAASLCATNTKIIALTWVSMSTSPELHPLPLTGIIQGLSGLKTALYSEAFGRLNSISIFLPADTSKMQINFEGLSAFICCLPMLADLEFSGTKYVHTKFDPSFLAGLHVPRLRSVEISNGIFTSPSNLTDFFSRHSQSLQRVKLHNVALENGSWESVFSHMRDTLNLRSSDMSGKFHNGDPYEPGSVEVGYGIQYHGIPALPRRSIEDFVERRTDVRPFDLKRASSRRYPEHVSADDLHQCLSGVCPHLYTPVEAENKLMARRREVTNNQVAYVLTRYDIYTLSLIFLRQGRMEEGGLLGRLALRREEAMELEQFQYCGGLLKLQDVH